MTSSGSRRVRAAVGEWIEALGRVGLAAKGIVYGLLGVLAMRVIVVERGAGPGPTDALALLREAPLGRVLLIAIGVGLFGYATYRLAQAIFDSDRVGSGPRAIGKRIAYALSGTIYGVLGGTALRLVAGHRRTSSEASTQLWTAKLMNEPFGRWWVAAVGVGVLIAAAVQFALAYRASFMRVTARDEMTPQTRHIVEGLGRAGHAARGVVFAIAGAFMLIAALHERPEDARGLGGALSSLAHQPYGPYLLVVVALGLAAYGAYVLALSRYRRIPMR